MVGENFVKITRFFFCFFFNNVFYINTFTHAPSGFWTCDLTLPLFLMGEEVLFELELIGENFFNFKSKWNPWSLFPFSPLHFFFFSPKFTILSSHCSISASYGEFSLKKMFRRSQMFLYGEDNPHESKETKCTLTSICLGPLKLILILRQ